MKVSGARTSATTLVSMFGLQAISTSAIGNKASTREKVDEANRITYTGIPPSYEMLILKEPICGNAAISTLVSGSGRSSMAGVARPCTAAQCMKESGLKARRTAEVYIPGTTASGRVIATRGTGDPHPPSYCLQLFFFFLTFKSLLSF